MNIMQNSPGINLPGANNAKSSTTGAGAGSPWREIPVVRTGQRRLASRPLPNGRRMHPNCLKQGLDDRAISLAENWTGETEVQTKFLHLFGDFDIAEIIVVSAIRATFPAVSVPIRASSQLRARITPHFSHQRAQFS